MTLAGFWPDDRERLLRNGRMETTVYSGRDPEDAARDMYGGMQHCAGLMGLVLSEPVMDVSDPDWTGARLVTVRVGVAAAQRRYG